MMENDIDRLRCPSNQCGPGDVHVCLCRLKHDVLEGKKAMYMAGEEKREALCREINELRRMVVDAHSIIWNTRTGSDAGSCPCPICSPQEEPSSTPLFNNELTDEEIVDIASQLKILRGRL